MNATLCVHPRRKVLLTGLLMFFNKGSLIQLTVGILLCVAFLSTVAWVQPFKSQAANTFKVGTVSEQATRA